MSFVGVFGKMELVHTSLHMRETIIIGLDLLYDSIDWALQLPCLSSLRIVCRMPNLEITKLHQCSTVNTFHCGRTKYFSFIMMPYAKSSYCLLWLYLGLIINVSDPQLCWNNKRKSPHLKFTYLSLQWFISTKKADTCACISFRSISGFRKYEHFHGISQTSVISFVARLSSELHILYMQLFLKIPLTFTRMIDRAWDTVN